jgi:cell division protease FtsH
MAELEDARDTVTMGVERITHVMTDEEKRLTAYREGGRALVALSAPATDPVHKVTILTRGSTTGQVQQLPLQDQLALTLEQMTSRLAILMAGRAAEELVFGRSRITSATAPDIEAATKLARRMVTRWGVSESLGPVAYAEDQEEVFLGHSIARPQTISPQTAQAISTEVRRLIDEALTLARHILQAQREALEAIARALLQKETLSEEEIRALVPGLSGGGQEVEQPARVADPREDAHVA